MVTYRQENIDGYETVQEEKLLIIQIMRSLLLQLTIIQYTGTVNWDTTEICILMI